MKKKEQRTMHEFEFKVKKKEDGDYKRSSMSACFYENSLHKNVCYEVQNWLEKRKCCQATRPRTIAENTEFDVIGGIIRRPKVKWYDAEVVLHAVEVKVKLTKDELDRAVGQLKRYRDAIDKSSWVVTSEYGKMMAGPEEVYLYICVPEGKCRMVFDLVKEEGYGLLSFNHKLTISEVSPPTDQANLNKITGMSTRNKRGRRFTIALKHHKIFGKLFSNYML